MSFTSAETAIHSAVVQDATPTAVRAVGSQKSPQLERRLRLLHGAPAAPCGWLPISTHAHNKCAAHKILTFLLCTAGVQALLEETYQELRYQTGNTERPQSSLTNQIPVCTTSTVLL